MARNFDGIQFEKYRRVVDERFNKLHDELEECYYKFWKNGESRSLQGYDVGRTKEESKETFDKLHGLIWHEYIIALKEYHDGLVVEEREVKFQAEIIDARIDPITRKDILSIYDIAINKKQELNAEGIRMITLAVERV